MRRDIDVCVIGSGAGGGPFALACAEAGLRVLVLEKGPDHSRAAYVHDEISIVRRDFFLPRLADDPHTLLPAGKEQSSRTELGWIAQCVGGGTVHMAGHFYRMRPEDFRMRSLYGGSDRLSLADWPFSYDDLEPYYTRVEETLGVSGNADGNPFEPSRSKPYPLPVVNTHPFGEAIDAAAARLGLHSFREARGILSRAYRGREACHYCDFCGSYGCETGAKSSSQEALLPAAVATGRCEVRAGCMVREITLGADGRVDGCVYFDTEGGERRVRSRVVAVAASAVESARLLLISRSPSFPDGLANSSGAVGRNLHFSAYSGGHAVYRFDSDPKRAMTLRHPAPFLGRSMQDFYFIPPEVAGIPKGGTIRFGFMHQNPIYRAMRVARETAPLRWGMDLKSKIRERIRESRTVEFETFADFFPNPGTRVDLDPEARDRWGLPAARIHLDIPEEHRKIGAWLQKKGLEVLAETKPDRLEGDAVGETTGHLVQGTCRMGTDPATSVLNGFGQAHDVPNLFVVDGSGFPHSGGVPSTLTIMANSFRSADHAVDALKRGDL